MVMVDSLDIATVTRLTGLSSRALRFYEARGLVRPLRSASGRRYYGPAELERVHQIVLLKRAGLTLTQIDTITRRGTIDFAALVDTQLAAVAAAACELRDAQALLLSVKSRIERSEPIDVATFCSLIRTGEQTMSTEGQAWKTISDQYMSEEAKADFAATQPQMPADFDSAAYAAGWKDLGDRIKAAMPMDLASDEALGFVREWFKQLEPFSRVATPAMWQGSRDMYANMDQWETKDGAPDAGFDHSVWQFINEATQAAKAAGKDIGPVPAFMRAP